MCLNSFLHLQVYLTLLSLLLSLYFRNIDLFYVPQLFKLILSFESRKCCSLFHWSLHSWLFLIHPDLLQISLFRKPLPNHPTLMPSPHDLTLHSAYFLCNTCHHLWLSFWFITLPIFGFPTCLSWALLFQQHQYQCLVQSDIQPIPVNHFLRMNE